jgi:hypothetical protein
MQINYIRFVIIKDNQSDFEIKIVKLKYFCPNHCNKTPNHCNRLNRVCTNFDQIAPESKHTLTVATNVLSIVTDDFERNFIA